MFLEVEQHRVEEGGSSKANLNQFVWLNILNFVHPEDRKDPFYTKGCKIDKFWQPNTLASDDKGGRENSKTCSTSVFEHDLCKSFVSALAPFLL